MGHYKDTTVEVKFNGKTVRVSQGVKDSLSKAKKLDGQKKTETK
tara:strand:+ start:157 stop:288 length:132 start_codon:yes stop_codon:yes gene_type:complete